MTDGIHPAEAFAAPEEDRERELPKMSFLEHLEELRKRLVVSIAALGVAFLICWNFADRIFGYIEVPLAKYLPAGEKMVYTRLTEPFMLYMKVAFFAGIFIPSDESISDAHCPLLPPRRAGSRCISHSTANGSIRSTNALAGVPLERMIREASVFAFRKRYRGRRIGSAMA